LTLKKACFANTMVPLTTIGQNADSLLSNRWRVRLIRFFTKREVYHTLFWSGLLLLLTIVEWESKSSNQDFFFTFSNELVNVFFYAIIVYFNTSYLIPNYLTKNKFLTYCGLLLLATFMLTPLKMIVFYFKFEDQPSAQNSLIRNQNWYFVFMFLFGASSTVVKIITDWVRAVREKQELETRTMQTELRFLKSQINPHFLFNTLNSLYALTLKKSEKAPEIVIKLSEMMRYMLYECNEKQVPLSNEVHYIRNYLDLEKLRQGQNVEINLEVEGNVSDQKIAPLMFIPFIENSFKHGLHNNISKAFVNMKLTVHGQNIEFFIENSKGEVLPLQEHRRSGGIGLVNVRRRLDILYPEHYALKINDTPRTYAVTLFLDLDGGK
jgi:two-component system LytT family sensor kinase